MKTALVQMRSGVSPDDNLAMAEALVREAASSGARYVQTPEMTNLLQKNPKQLFSWIFLEADDPFISHFRKLAAELEIWLHLGSVAVKHEQSASHAANRALLIDPNGEILCRYDKVHMFDVDLGEGNKWQESAVYQPGSRLAVADIGDAMLGLGICYDLRFPALARAEAQAGAQLLTFPAAFTRVSGESHWHTLLRARAIENGAFVLAAAQGGKHEDGRETYGHSLVYSPWGELVAELGHDEPGVLVCDLDLSHVKQARRKIPSLGHDREFVVEKFGADAG